MYEVTISLEEYKSLVNAKFVADMLTNLLKKKLNESKHYLDVEEMCELLGIERSENE